VKLWKTRAKAGKWREFKTWFNKSKHKQRQDKETELYLVIK